MKYTKGQCMSIKAKLLKRLEKAEKKIIPGSIDVFVFIEESEEPGTYNVHQIIYRGDNQERTETCVKASNAQEVADNYRPPEECKEPLIFKYDFGK